MRALLATAAIACLLLPGAASAGRVECDRLERQIGHYQGMLDRAKELDNELWVERTEAHLDRLRERHDDKCPKFDENIDTAAALAHLFKVAGKAALTFFTMGMM